MAPYPTASDLPIGVVDTSAGIGHYAPVSKPPLRSNEREIATYRAGRSQGNRVVGGHLLLTDQRLIFYPHKLDDAMGGKRWECKLESLKRSAGRLAE